MQAIRVGVIGASPGPSSWAANAHIPALRARHDVELVAVSTSRRESAEVAAAAYGVEAFDHPLALIDHRAVELVVVAVSAPQHRELVTAAIRRGKMVYCEWPLGIDLPEAEHLCELARSAGVRSAIGLQGRFSPVVSRARELVAEGYIGKVLATTIVGSGVAWGGVTDSHHAYLYDRASGVTTLTASAMHALDAITFILGEPTGLKATMTVGRKAIELADGASTLTPTAPDQIAVTGTLTGGAALSLFYRGGTSRGTNLIWEINGSEGDLVITTPTPSNGNVQAIELKLSGGRGAQEDVSELPLTAATVPNGPAGNVARLYAALARDLRDGTRTVPDFDYAVSRHRIAAAIEVSAQT